MVILNGVYSGFKSYMYHYFNVCTCALCVLQLSTCLWLAANNSGNTHQNENMFLAFGSLISNAVVENAMISDCIIVCSKFSGTELLCFFFCSVMNTVCHNAYLYVCVKSNKMVMGKYLLSLLYKSQKTNCPDAADFY